MKNANVCLLFTLPLAVFAASNPEVVPPECDDRNVSKECEGVTGPSAGMAVGWAECSNFIFRLEGVLPGSERLNQTEYWTGGDVCPESKKLDSVEVPLDAHVSWTADAGGVTKSDSGERAVIPRTNGACRATCTYEVTVSPTYCSSAPAPLVRTAEAVFEDAVSVSERTKARLCCTSSSHSPHVFALSGCDLPTLRIDPPAAASVVSQDGHTACVLGRSGHENALAIAEAPCGSGSNAFDVVGIDSFVVSGLCGCRSVSDSSDDDADAPRVDTMDFGVDVTGFALSLGVTPVKWAGDARWRGSESGWMPREGAFGGGDQKSRLSVANAVTATFDAWFDCEPNSVRADDEPKRRVIGELARLGVLKTLANPDARKGVKNACDEAFAPGETVSIANTGFLPSDRIHKLKISRTLAEDKKRPMTVSTSNISSSGANTWNLKIPSDCPNGLFWVELTDPLHSCTSLVKRLQVQSCLCTSCDEFANKVLKNGCVDVSFGLGRTASGGAKAPVRFVLEQTDVLPDISSEDSPDGRMDVSIANGVMSVSFTRTGAAAPVAVFTLTPGANAFTLREMRDGSHRTTSRWTVADGVWTMEVTDETVVPAQLIQRDVRSSRTTARGTAETLVSGDMTTETESEQLADYGPVRFRETCGVGAEARTTWMSYVTSGPVKGRIRSEVEPDGSWMLYAYDPTGRVASVIAPFGDTPPVLDDKNAVTGYNGAVRRTQYGYEPVDPRDDGSSFADEARTVVESVGSDSLGWTEVSRRYVAHFVADGERVEISERAAAAGAACGAAGNLRTVSSYLWNCLGAGRPLRRVTPDGLVTVWSYVFSPSNTVVETMTVPATATNGVPFKTTISRSVEDLRGDVLREETYVMTDAGRELLFWTDFERDAAGHELRRASSDGSVVERAWSCCGPEWERDERGIVTDRAYDALGRESVSVRIGVATLSAYDLAGNATNVTRSAGGLVATSSSGYDSAGRLVRAVGEDGVRTEYLYGTSPEGGEVRTVIRAVGTACAVTNTAVSFRDGTSKASYLNGRLVSTEVHAPFAETSYAGTNGVGSLRWNRTETDFLGRTVAGARPGFGGAALVTSNRYDAAGRLVASGNYAVRNSRFSILDSQLHSYDAFGERTMTVDDRDFDGAVDWTGPDLVSSNLTWYVKLGNAWWRESKVFSVHRDGSSDAQLVRTTRSRLTGLGADSLASETVSIDLRGNATTNRTFRNPAAAEEITWTKYPTSTTPAVTTSTNGLVRSSTSQTGVTATFAYDGFGRETSATDGRGNVTRTVYDALGRVSSTIDALGYATAYCYDALGRQTSVTDPLTNTVYTAYDSEGHVVSQRGATYPVDYSYDEFGEKISMTTYRDFIGERGTGNGESVGVAVQGDVTRWLRDEATGLVTNKVYADGKGPTYAYTPDGRLATRTWARGIVTTYSYDDNGSLTNTVYSDGTPTVSLAYDRAGRQVKAHDAAGVTTFLYDSSGAVTNETVVGVAGTNTIERYYDSFGRDAGYALNGVRQSMLAYDPATGRLASMLAAGSDTPFTWSYLPGSDLKSSLFDPNGLTASWTYDANGQLLQVKNAFPTNTISQYDYVYGAAGRRISVSKSGTAFNHDDTIAYGYNARSELTNAVASVDSAYQYAYDFDDIGNRGTSSERGTNSVYTANNLNQYTAVDDFMPQFDDDGNQTLIRTTTGIWSVTYNGENRPILWSNGSTNIVMAFDRMGRRVTKNDLRFVYDGYLQIANFEVASTNSQLTTHNAQLFIWDPTEPVATRPLVWNRDSSAVYYTHDGNKNVSEVVSSENEISAHYEHAPFGSVLVMHGECASANPWRFSSEYAEDDSATVYYNYRHYEPVAGRWLSFDPAGTSGGQNWLAFARNDAIGSFDSLGEIGVRFITKAFVEEKILWIIPRRVEKWVDVNSPEDVHINYVKSIVSMTRGGAVHSSLGQFSTKVVFDRKACTVCVILSINMRDDLAEESSANVVYRVTPHKKDRHDGSTGVYKDGKLDASHSPLKGAIMAHERGHARAYLTLVKPEFESEMKNFVLSNMGVISNDEAKKIRRIHDRIDNRHVKESGQYANDAESSWYMGNGFNRKQVGEYYEYSK